MLDRVVVAADWAEGGTSVRRGTKPYHPWTNGRVAIALYQRVASAQPLNEGGSARLQFRLPVTAQAQIEATAASLAAAHSVDELTAALQDLLSSRLAEPTFGEHLGISSAEGHETQFTAVFQLKSADLLLSPGVDLCAFGVGFIVFVGGPRENASR